MTQLSSVTTTLVCSDGQLRSRRATVTLPVAALSDSERYEGMHISIGQELTVTEVFTLGRFGEVALSVGAAVSTTRPTSSIRAPGAVALQNLNDRSRILLDDGNNQQNIDPTNYPTGGLSASNTLRGGRHAGEPLRRPEFRFSVYRVQPVEPAHRLHPHATAPGGAGARRRGPPGCRVQRPQLLQRQRHAASTARPAASRPRAAPRPSFEFNRQRDKIISAHHASSTPTSSGSWSSRTTSPPAPSSAPSRTSSPA